MSIQQKVILFENPDSMNYYENQINSYSV